MERISSEVRKQNKEASNQFSIQMKRMQTTLTEIKRKVRSYHLIEEEVDNKIIELNKLVDSFLNK